MFRTVPLSIIRSFSLYTQQWYNSYRFCWQLASRIRRSVLILLASCQQNLYELLVEHFTFIAFKSGLRAWNIKGIICRVPSSVCTQWNPNTWRVCASFGIPRHWSQQGIFFLNFVQWTNKFTINWEIITLLLNVSTLLRHPQADRG